MKLSYMRYGHIWSRYDLLPVSIASSYVIEVCRTTYTSYIVLGTRCIVHCIKYIVHCTRYNVRAMQVFAHTNIRMGIT